MRRLRPLLITLCLLVGLTVAPAWALGGDPGLPQQWGLHKIGAPTAWNRSVGAGTPIAVIDTGIDLGHADLKGQIQAAVTCIDTDGDPNRCRADGADIQGHGSHVAGIAAAASDNNGVAGVAPSARIVAVRVFVETRDPVSGQTDYVTYSDDINAGIRWAIRNIPSKGAINLSLGGEFLVTTVAGSGFEDGIAEAWQAGWVPVLASGNDNFSGLESQNYGSLNALVVGATGPADEQASYSSSLGDAKWGLVAPGGNARSGNGKSACANEPNKCVLSTYKGGGYGYLQGTSMAAPHVSGAVALLMSTGMSNADAVNRILQTANKGVSCGSRCHGRLDVAAAVGSGAPAAGSPPPPPSGGSGAPPPGGSPPPASSGGSTGRSTPPRRAPASAPATSAPAVAPPDAAPVDVEVVDPVATDPAAEPDPGSRREVVAADFVEESANEVSAPLRLLGAASVAAAAAATAVALRRRGWRLRAGATP